MTWLYFVLVDLLSVIFWIFILFISTSLLSWGIFPLEKANKLGEGGGLRCVFFLTFICAIVRKNWELPPFWNILSHVSFVFRFLQVILQNLALVPTGFYCCSQWSGIPNLSFISIKQSDTFVCFSDSDLPRTPLGVGGCSFAEHNYMLWKNEPFPFACHLLWNITIRRVIFWVIQPFYTWEEQYILSGVFLFDNQKNDKGMVDEGIRKEGRVEGELVRAEAPCLPFPLSFYSSFSQHSIVGLSLLL